MIPHLCIFINVQIEPYSALGDKHYITLSLDALTYLNNITKTTSPSKLLLILSRASLCSQSLSYLWSGLNFPLRFCSMLIWMHRIISADSSAAHWCYQALVLPHSKGFLLDQDLVTGEATEVHCHVHETSLRRLLLCNMKHYPPGRHNLSMVNCTWWATILNWTVIMFN